jgi:hypothetical protein
MTLEGKSRSSDGTLEQWWFNLKTGLTEFGLQSASSNRVGPFASESEANRALDLIAERALAWQESESDEKD